MAHASFHRDDFKVFRSSSPDRSASLAYTLAAPICLFDSEHKSISRTTFPQGSAKVAQWFAFFETAAIDRVGNTVMAATSRIP